MDDTVQGLVRTVFETCARLTQLTGRPVSPDWHLVGTLGEIIASELLDLELMRPSTRGYDAIGSHGVKVETKTPTRLSIASSATETEPRRQVQGLRTHRAVHPSSVGTAVNQLSLRIGVRFQHWDHDSNGVDEYQHSWDKSATVPNQ